MNTEDTRHQMERNLEKLRALRDQIRLELHLASMEAKERWEQLEPRLEDAQKFAENVTDVSRKAVADIVARFEDFKASLQRHQNHRHPPA